MKFFLRKYFAIAFAFLSFSLYDLRAQELQIEMVNATTIRIVSSPNSPQDIFDNVPPIVQVPGPQCSFVTGFGSLSESYTLWKAGINVPIKTQSNRSDFTITPGGEYYVTASIPTATFTGACAGNSVVVFNLIGQRIGRGGYLRTVTSNAVGDIPTAQNQYSFIDGGGGNSIPNGFDFGERVQISTNMPSHTQYFLAIYELGSPRRMHATNGWNWVQGAVPSIVDLSLLWGQGGGGDWKFEPLNSYRVQLAISRPGNTIWSVNEQEFFICPSGSGCREVHNEKNIAISPNPTSNSFRLSNLNLDKVGDYKVTLNDYSGRTVKTFTNISQQDFDISDLSNGFYIVNLWNQSKRVHTAKLSVVK